MNKRHDDPRIRKTRRGLQEALVRLILRKGYDAISIQDIATEAETARVTFYRHYRDKDELLTDCLDTLYQELVQKTERLNREDFLRGRSPVTALYEHIEEQENLYRILFSSRGSQTVLERLRHYVATRSLEAIQTSGLTPIADVPFEVIANHAASAQLGLAIWWLDHEKPYPPQYMAQISLWLSLTGIIKTMGISDADLPAPVLNK